MITPGEWRAKTEGPTLGVVSVDSVGKEITLAIVRRTVVHRYTQRTQVDGAANALVMAASKEMLEAPKDLTSIAQDDERRAAPLVFARAESAIAKAEGRA